jgi:hypothetical protein
MNHIKAELALKVVLSATVLIGKFLVGSLMLSATKQSAQFLPTIAGVTAGIDSLDKIRSLYGNGAETNVQDPRSLCYCVEQDRAYLSVSSFEHESRIRSIALTTFQDVAPGCHAARIIGKHSTALAGISLGDSTASVTSILGAPSGKDKMQMANHELVYTAYSVAGGQPTCQFEEDKLVVIAVEASPGQHPNREQASIVVFAESAAPSIFVKGMPQALPEVAMISPRADGKTS